MTLTVATWNVNSIRARTERLLDWLARRAPDVLCLQETKVEDDEFPRDVLQAAGYHAAVFGQKTYNGVAILSPNRLADIEKGLGDDPGDTEARLIAATVDGVRVICAYVPLGTAVGTDKWVRKLEWFKRLRGFLERNAKSSDDLLVCGDLNVAPQDRDVARSDEWRESVLCHEEGRAALRDLMEWGLIDSIRLHHDGPGPGGITANSPSPRETDSGSTTSSARSPWPPDAGRRSWIATSEREASPPITHR